MTRLGLERDAPTVGAPDLDTAVTDVLSDMLRSSDAELSVLLGAGASMTVGLPDWETLGVRLLIGSGVITEEETARAFLTSQDAMLAVEAARAVMGPDAWSELLRESLYGTSSIFSSALHRAVAALAALRDEGSTRLFTLNFDTLLEDALAVALEEVGRDPDCFVRAKDTPRAPRGTVEVNHLHGVVFPERGRPAESVVLGLSDFVGLPAASWQLGELQQAVQHGPLILAGTSYRDPDVRSWVYDLTSHRHGPSPVAVLVSRASIGLSREQFDTVRDALVSQWEAVGVRPILIHDHADAAQCLREVPHLTEPGYEAPRRRAMTLWEACRDHFNHLQEQHSEVLGEDLAELQAQLGEDTNVTLWVANADGGLVRWASPDRLYKSADRLRTVPLGFDSPWIAGQCLAIDDVLAREPVEDPGATRRWRSVVASPITVPLPGGPPLAVAVLSSASTHPLDRHDLDGWQDVLTERANLWADRLRSVVAPT